MLESRSRFTFVGEQTFAEGASVLSFMASTACSWSISSTSDDSTEVKFCTQLRDCSMKKLPFPSLSLGTFSRQTWMNSFTLSALRLSLMSAQILVMQHKVSIVDVTSIFQYTYLQIVFMWYNSNSDTWKLYYLSKYRHNLD